MRRSNLFWNRLLAVVVTIVLSLAGFLLIPAPDGSSQFTALRTIGARIAQANPDAVRPESARQQLSDASTCQTFGAETGFGIIGDSTSDEYRADDARGGTFAATTLNWVEILAARRGVNFGPWGTWGEPRRGGYEYNWSRSGATTDDMISGGFHSGLAQQVADGKVSHVLVQIGVNDFQMCCGAYADIYNGTLSGARLETWIDQKVSNVTIAIDTVRLAGPVKVALTNIPDVGLSPDIIGSHPEPAKRQRVTDAINRMNGKLARLAADRGIAYLDMFSYAHRLLDSIVSTGSLRVDTVEIGFRRKSNDPHAMRLDDTVGHAGTVMSGIYANEFGIRPMREAFGLCIEPLTEREILESAGLVART